MTPNRKRQRYPGVHREKSRHGKLCWYYREDKGRRTRLPDAFGGDEFKAAYKRALAGDATPMDRVTTSKGAWAWMVMQYLQSRSFSELATSTQKQRRKLLRDAAKRAGKRGPEAVTEASIRRAMIERPPHAANNFLKALRGFYGWAIEMGYIERDSNPTTAIARNTTKGDGWDVWTVTQVQAFRAAWPKKTMERRAFEIILRTGLRRSDAIQLTRFHDRGDIIEIKAKKNGVTCYIEVTPDLREWMIAGDHAHYLISPTGKPFSEAMFGKWFGQACMAANLPRGLRAHSLRKTAATIDAEEGRTAHWLMAKFGWVKLDEAERYTRKASRRQVIQGNKVRDGSQESRLGSILSNDTGTLKEVEQ